MPGVRRAIVVDLPRGRLGTALQRQLADLLRQASYGQALVMSRKWKAAFAPWLAGIPLRTGFAGEFRFGLLNDVRFGERQLPRMIDRMGALALPKSEPLPDEWPLPELKVPPQEVESWLKQRGLVNESPSDHYAVARRGRRRQSVAGRSVCRTGAGPRKRWCVSLDRWRSERIVSRDTNCGCRRQQRSQSHEFRSTQCDFCARRRRSFRHQRFRADACVRGNRHTDSRNFWPDQPLALETT